MVSVFNATSTDKFHRTTLVEWMTEVADRVKKSKVQYDWIVIMAGAPPPRSC